MNVLIVDDDKSISIYISQLLKKWGYTVFCSDDGEQAWQTIQNNQINLVITDWMMPGISGIELTKKLRQCEFPQYIYIIILTGRRAADDVIVGINAGADDFLTKPINPRELEVRIKAANRIIELEQSLQDKNTQLKNSKHQVQNHLDKLQEDLNAAALLQRALLPKANESIAGVEIAWNYQPADELAGDMLGFHTLSEHQLSFYLLDVSGHGVPAAMLSIYLHHRLTPEKKVGDLIYQMETSTDEPKDHLKPEPTFILRDPAQIVYLLNQEYDAEKYNMLYFTLVYGILDTQTGAGRLCQAGHPYPLQWRGLNGVERIGKGGFPIGLLSEAHYENISFQLNPGETLLLYSDGFSECFNQQEQAYGIERLEEKFNQFAQQDSHTLVENLVYDLKQWQNSETSSSPSYPDDVTLLVIKKAEN